MLLRRDVTVTLYGFKGFDSLFPWDPLSEEMPERVAPPLEEDFLQAWAESTGDRLEKELAEAEEAEEQSAKRTSHGKRAGTAVAVKTRSGWRGARAPDPEALLRTIEAAKPAADAAQRDLVVAEGEARATGKKLDAAREWTSRQLVEVNIGQTDFALARADAESARKKLEEMSQDVKEVEEQLREAEERVSAAPWVLALIRRPSLVMLRRRVRAAKRDLEPIERVARDAERIEANAAAGYERREAALVQAQERMSQAGTVDARARERVAEARLRVSRTTSALARALREAAPGEPLDNSVYQWVFATRPHQVLACLAMREWSRRATGHGSEPRFIVELWGEKKALWLYEGKWYEADSDLRRDDIMIMVDEALGPDIESEIVTLVWERDGGRCTHCGAVGNLELAYVVPLARGGSREAGNMRLLCVNCSREKSHDL